MSRKKSLISRLLIALLTLCLVFADTVRADNISDVQEDIQEDERRKKEEEEKAAYYRGLKAELQKELETANDDLDELIESLQDIDRQVREVNQDLEELARQTEEGEATLAEQKSAMALRIRYMYEQQTASFWEMLADAKTLGDVLNSADYISSLSTYDHKMQEAYKEQLQALEDCRLETEQKKQEILELQARTEARKAAIVSRIDEILAKMNDYSSRIDTANAEAAALRQEISEQQEQLKKLQEAARLAAEEARRKAEAEALARRKAEQMKPSDARGVGSTDIRGDWLNPSGYTNLELLAAILECECGNQTWEGQVAVGNVIYNRILDPHFQMTLYDVIYGPGQFTPVESGTLAIVLARGAKQQCRQIAQDILNGARVIDTRYLFFCSPASWVNKPKKYTEYTFICYHYFYY